MDALPFYRCLCFLNTCLNVTLDKVCTQAAHKFNIKKKVRDSNDISRYLVVANYYISFVNMH